MNPADRELLRDFWAWTCADPRRLARLVFLAAWTLSLAIVTLDVIGQLA